MTPVNRRYVAFSGIAFVLLFGTGSSLFGFEMPRLGAPPTEVVGYFEDTSARIIAGGSMSIVGVAAFVFFAAALRRMLTDIEGDDVLATTAFGGAVLALAGGLTAETVNMAGALRAQDGELSDSVAQSLFEISQVSGSVIAGVGIAIFALAIATVALRSGMLMPRGLAVLMLITGLAMLTPLARIAVVPSAVLVVVTLLVALPLLRNEPRTKINT